MNEFPYRIAYLTAGAAGMYCGSCMHDNTLARALSRLGVDVQLIPLYTPVRTDEQNVSIDQVFLGGVNVYLQQKLPLFRHLPGFLDRLWDQPWLLRWATSRAMKADSRTLGALTVSMLRGQAGYQSKEVQRLCAWLSRSPRPHLINLSNMLIAGCVPLLKQQLGIPLLVTLQGDDIFLDQLPEPYRGQALEEIQRLGQQVDGLIVYSRYYADYMADYLRLPREKFHITPLGVDIEDFREFALDRQPRTVEPSSSLTAMAASRPPTVGYLARLAPEKGLHVLVDAFLQLRRRPGMQQARLRIAGWLGDQHRRYVQQQFDKLRGAGLEGAYDYLGEVDRREKIEFFKQIDILSVPTVYREPKGLFVLEALAAGVPVVQPDHGAFPELLSALGGGRLVRPNHSGELADQLYELLSDPAGCVRLGQNGLKAVHGQYHAEAMARTMLEIFQGHLNGQHG